MHCDQQELAQVVSSLMPLKGGLGFEPHRMQKTLVGRFTHHKLGVRPGSDPDVVGAIAYMLCLM